MGKQEFNCIYPDLKKRWGPVWVNFKLNSGLNFFLYKFQCSHVGESSNAHHYNTQWFLNQIVLIHRKVLVSLFYLLDNRLGILVLSVLF